MPIINTMTRAYICSPYRGNIEANLRYLDQAIKYSLDLGEAPYAPHLYLPKYFDDNVAAKRYQALRIGEKFLSVCNIIAVYTDYGISDGMQGEIDYAKSIRIPIIIRKIQ